MPKQRIAAVALFVLGTGIASVPACLQLGWSLIATGILVGTAIGVASGVLWAMQPARA